MDHLQLKLCDIQGRLFELSARNDLDSSAFVQAFMHSRVAAALDSSYNRLQWAGEEYLLEELMEEKKADLISGGTIFDENMLYWIGYLYRYWHFSTGENSRVIYRQAPVLTMKRNYLMLHTVDPQIAIEDLKGIYHQKYTA